MLFRETPAEHPKDNNGQTCSPMRGEGSSGRAGRGQDAATAAGLCVQHRSALRPKLCLQLTPPHHCCVCTVAFHLPGYFYRPSTGELVVSAANRINVKGWNSGMTANTATNKILGE